MMDQLTCQGLVSAFALALKRTAIVVDKKPTIPLLANVKVEASAESQSVKFVGSNSFLTAGCKISASVTSSGAAAVDQQRFYDLVSRLPQDKRLTLQMTEAGLLALKCGSARYELASVNADDLPPSPRPGKADRIEIPASALLRLLTVAGRAMLESDDRSHLSGVWFGWNQKSAFGVATDGLRLHRIEIPLESGSENTIFIPHRAVHAMRKFAETLSASTAVSIAAAASTLYFWVESVGFSSKMVESKLFDHTKTLPAKHTSSAEVSAPRLTEGLARLRVVSDEPIRFFADKAAGWLEVTAASGVAAGKELVKGKIKGGDEVVLRSEHVLDLVDVSGAATVKMSFSDGRQAVLLKPLGLTDEEIIGIAMPIQEATQ